MTFKDIALKILRANVRKYLYYFINSSFAIMTFFMYSTLFFNPNLTQSINNLTNQKDLMNKLFIMMSVIMIVIGLFSILFISYAHSSFIKYRKREFGLFLTLGMNNKDINKLIKIENSIIGGLSLVFGLVLGTIFSRLFFLVIINLLDLANIKFTLSYKSYLLTISVFITIFSVVIALSRFLTGRLEITELLKESRKVKNNKVSHPLFGLLGLLLIILSMVLLDLHLKDKILIDQNNYILLFIAICLVGLYITISQIGSSLINLTKIHPKIYYKNLLTLTELNHKFSQNKKMFYVICLLSAITIFFIGIAYSLYSQTLKTVISEQPHHIIYMETATINKLPQNQLAGILKPSRTPVTSQKTLDFIHINILKTYQGKKDINFGNIKVISEGQFESLSERSINIKKGEALTLVQVDAHQPLRDPWFSDKKLKLTTVSKPPPGGSQATAKTDGKTFEYDFKGEINEIIINRDYHDSWFMVILNNQDFDALRNSLGENYVGTFHIIDFDNWYQTGETVKRLNAALKNLNDEKSNIQRDTFEVKSRIGIYDILKRQNSFLLFIVSFIGLLFFISSGSVIYFKVHTEIDEVKEKYQKLYKLGITYREMKKAISRELSLIFFVSPLLGCALGYTFISIMTANVSNRQQMLQDSLFIIGVYFILQIIYFLITKKKLVQEIAIF